MIYLLYVNKNNGVLICQQFAFTPADNYSRYALGIGSCTGDHVKVKNTFNVSDKD